MSTPESNLQTLAQAVSACHKSLSGENVCTLESALDTWLTHEILCLEDPEREAEAEYFDYLCDRE